MRYFLFAVSDSDKENTYWCKEIHNQDIAKKLIEEEEQRQDTITKDIELQNKELPNKVPNKEIVQNKANICLAQTIKKIKNTDNKDFSIIIQFEKERYNKEKNKAAIPNRRDLAQSIYRGDSKKQGILSKIEIAQTYPRAANEIFTQNTKSVWNQTKRKNNIQTKAEESLVQKKQTGTGTSFCFFYHWLNNRLLHRYYSLQFNLGPPGA